MIPTEYATGMAHMRRIPALLMTTILVLVTCGCTRKSRLPALTRPSPVRDAPFFDATNEGGNQIFYISVDLGRMDVTRDDPTPTAEQPSIEYTACAVTLEDRARGTTETYPDARVRYKGNTTFDKHKPQFKLRFARGHRFHGHRTINLHSEWKDATLIREKLVYDLFARVGVTAPRAVHVRVYVRDLGVAGSEFAYYGLYTAVEQVDRDFLARHFGQARSGGNLGNLYKAYWGWKGIDPSFDAAVDVNAWDHTRRGFADLRVVGDGSAAQYTFGNGWASTYAGQARAYRLRSNKRAGMEDYSDLAAFIMRLNQLGDVEAELPEFFEVDGFLRWLAANTLVGGWDNYWFNAQNYYLYNIDNQGRWAWIAWDYDNSLGNQFREDVFVLPHADIFYDMHPDLRMIHTVLSVPVWRQRYVEYLEQFIAGGFNPAAMNARVETLAARLRPYVESDTRKQYSNAEWAENLDSLIIEHSDEDGVFGNQAHHYGIEDYVARRVASVQRQIAAARAAASDRCSHATGCRPRALPSEAMKRRCALW